MQRVRSRQPECWRGIRLMLLAQAESHLGIAGRLAPHDLALASGASYALVRMEPASSRTGTEGSNLAPSGGESCANLTSSLRGEPVYQHVDERAHLAAQVPATGIEGNVCCG
jgi:hypothetical protein